MLYTVKIKSAESIKCFNAWFFLLEHKCAFEPSVIVAYESLSCLRCEKMDLKIIVAGTNSLVVRVSTYRATALTATQVRFASRGPLPIISSLYCPIWIFFFTNIYIYHTVIVEKVSNPQKCWKTKEFVGPEGFFWRTAGSLTVQEKQGTHEQLSLNKKHSCGSFSNNTVLRIRGV